MEGKFNQQDKEKVIEFLNMIANKAKFEMDTNDVIKYYHLLAHMQKEILPKIDNNIMEVTKVIEDKENK